MRNATFGDGTPSNFDASGSSGSAVNKDVLNARVAFVDRKLILGTVIGTVLLHRSARVIHELTVDGALSNGLAISLLNLLLCRIPSRKRSRIGSREDSLNARRKGNLSEVILSQLLLFIPEPMVWTVFQFVQAQTGTHRKAYLHERSF